VKKKVVKHLIKHFGLSVRRACRLALIARSTYLYESKPNNDDTVVEEIEKILSKNSKYGCGMIHLKLRQSGMKINHKKTERIYRKQGLQLKKRKRRKKITAEERIPVELPLEPMKIWAMDFISDSLAFKRKLKILTVIDPVTNKSPVIYPAISITGKDVSDILDFTCESTGYPEYIQCDNGPEFRSRDLDEWCYRNGVKIIFSRPGTPTDNCHIESFNGTFRYECLNSNYFESLTSAREIIEDWWTEYNEERPQKRLKGMTPNQYEDMLNKLKTNLTNGRKVG
jgi:putative transposase